VDDNNRFIRYIYLFILFSFLILKPTYAADNNVEDCFEDGADCEQFDNVYFDEQNDEKEQSNESDQSRDPFIVNESDNGPSLVSSFLKMIFALLLVLGLIYVMLKFVNRRQQLFQQTQTLENLGGISVGQNKSIQVVRVGSKMYLIGVGDNVQLLKEIEDDDIIETLTNRQVVEPLSFKQWFKSLFPMKSNREKIGSQHSFNRLLADELDKMKQNRQQMIDQLEKKEDKHE